VARAYFELRSLDLQLDIARRTIVTRRESLQLAKDRFEGGLTPETDYRQAEAELFRMEAIVSDIEMAIAQKENELSVLLGRNPGPILRGRLVTEQKLPAAVPAGLPSTLIERRPDILAAEQVLAAATANIGQAKALLFPRISLTGSYGFTSTEFDTLFDGPSKAWNLIGNILQPIFHFNKNKRQVLYEYERTILQAFRETDDALVAYRKTGEQRTSQGGRVLAERKVLELADMRYRGGVAAYLEVLDAQRSLFGAEMDETSAIRQNLVSLVQLYKSLGGGWPSTPEEAAAPPVTDPQTLPTPPPPRPPPPPTP
jgi:multidrug efflux system outer membrane protein